MANLNDTPTDDTEPTQMVPLPDAPEDAAEAPESAAPEPAAPDSPDTPPSDTPAVAPTAVAPEPQAPDPALVAREAAITQREQEAATQQAEFEHTRQTHQLENDLRTYQTQLESGNFTPAQITERLRTAETRAAQAEELAIQKVAFLQAQTRAALHYSKEFGIPINDIANLASQDEMEAAGKRFKANAASSDEVAKLRAEVAELKQDKVPADQTFDDGGGGSPEGRDRKSRLDYLNNKDGHFTDAEWEELSKLMANT